MNLEGLVRFLRSAERGRAFRRSRGAAGQSSWLELRVGGLIRHLRKYGPGTGLRGGAPGAISKLTWPGWEEIAARVRLTARAARRAALESLGSLVTVVVDDWSVRAVLVTGNRVREWGRAELPPGVVRDGTVIDRAAFKKILEGLIASLYEGSKLRGRDVALAVGGRTHVQARFNVSIDDEDALEDAVMAAAEERFSFDSSALQLDWSATRIDSDEDEGMFGAVDADEIEQATYDVYALGMYRNVVDSELGALREMGAWPVDARPRALALSAAVNEEQAIILDLEPRSIAVIVLMDGLPEIVRVIGVDPECTDERYVELAHEQIETTVGFHDSINPGAHLSSDAGVYVTGSWASRGRTTGKILAGLPYPASPLPALVTADPAFPLAEYAANVGLAVGSGNRPWQRARVKTVPMPRFRFIPPEFPMRPRPVRTISAGLALATLILVLGLAIGVVGDVRLMNDRRSALGDELNRRVEQRQMDIREAAVLQGKIDRIESDTGAIFTATEAVSDRDGGFASALTGVAGLLPRGVLLRQLADDGELVTASFSASTPEALLGFARALESAPGFARVSIRSIARSGATAGISPAGGSGPIPSLPAISGLADLIGMAGRGGPGAPQIPGSQALLPPASPAADPGLANFFTMSVRITRAAGAPETDRPERAAIPQGLESSR